MWATLDLEFYATMIVLNANQHRLKSISSQTTYTREYIIGSV